MEWASHVLVPPESERVRYNRGLSMPLGRRERGGGWTMGWISAGHVEMGGLVDLTSSERWADARLSAWIWQLWKFRP